MITKIDNVHTLTYSNDQLSIGGIHADVMKLQMNGVKRKDALIKLRSIQLENILNQIPFACIDLKQKGYVFYGVKAVIDG